MNLSMSISKGNGNLKHNTRTQKIIPKNINKEKIKDNVILIDKDIKKEYEIIFGESVKKYNDKQKRSDRKIKNYYSKIVNDKKTKIFHELVIQVGNKNEQIHNLELTNKIYKEFVDKFIEKNSNLKVIGAYIHNDEETPHLHLDYIPVAEYSRGLSKRVSNDKAIVQMGYENWKDWKDKTFLELERICAINNIKRELKNNKNKHIENVELFKSIQKEKELLEIEKKDLDYKRNITAIEREKYNNELKYYKSSKLRDKEPKKVIKDISIKETLINNNYLKISKEDWHNHLNEIDKCNDLISLLEQKNNILLKENKELKEQKENITNRYILATDNFSIEETKRKLVENKYNQLIKINNDIEYNKKIQKENEELKIEITEQKEYIKEMEIDNQNTYDYFKEDNDKLNKKCYELEKQNKKIQKENEVLKNRLDKYIDFYKKIKILVRNLFKNKFINHKEVAKEFENSNDNEIIKLRKEVYLTEKEVLENKFEELKKCFKEKYDEFNEILLNANVYDDYIEVNYNGRHLVNLTKNVNVNEVIDEYVNQKEQEKNMNDYELSI